MGASNSTEGDLPEKNWQTITWKEVAKHDVKGDCWIVIGENVYDVSKYDDHPGGIQAILDYAGGDATKPFKEVEGHEFMSKSVLAKYQIGKIEFKPQARKYQIKQLSKTWQKRTYRQKDLEQHVSEDSLWVVIDDQVLDLTEFAGKHPGGERIIFEEAGKDASAAFKRVPAHPGTEALAKYRIGKFRK